MTLEEAKELLKKMKENAIALRMYHDDKAELKAEAIDTVLKALEEYESKLDNYTWEELDEIEKKIIELKKKKYSSSIKQKKYRKKYNENHKEQYREWQRRWRKNNPEKVKEAEDEEGAD